MEISWETYKNVLSYSSEVRNVALEKQGLISTGLLKTGGLQEEWNRQESRKFHTYSMPLETQKAWKCQKAEENSCNLFSVGKVGSDPPLTQHGAVS